MKRENKISRIFIAVAFLAFVSAGMTSCKAQKEGCPNKITKAETEQEVHV